MKNTSAIVGALTLALGVWLTTSIRMSNSTEPEDFDCPVTVANGFVPTSVPDPRPDQYRWHGSEDLFVPFDGDGRHFPRKTVLWSVHFPGDPFEVSPALQVTWRRLDVAGQAWSNTEGATNAHTVRDGWFMIAGLDPDESGCWQVDASYKGANLTYVYEV